MKTSDIKLIITVALKKEMPEEWLMSHHVQVYTLSALKAGALNQLNRSNLGILVVITGTGLKASKEAACWIRDNLNPLFVLNIGTCGLTDRSHWLCKWIRPRYVSDEEGNMIELDTRLPVPFRDEITEVHSLISVKEPQLGELTPSLKSHDAIDMECYAQAKVFSKTDISFHSLKFGSDYSDHNACSDFEKHLKFFTEETKKLFGFISAQRKIKVTVIVPVYNREASIKRAIDSVLSQSHKPEKVIVVDDGSTDGTKEILKGYGSKLNCVFMTLNSGPSSARNEGIKHARTEWIAFLDSDDRWEKDKLKNQIEYLKKYPFYQILQSEEVWIRNGVRVNPCKHHKKPVGWIWEPSLERCLVSPSGVLVKRTLLKQYGNFNETLPVCEDYDLWLKISRHHPVGLESSFSVVKYGGHKDQLSSKYPAMDRFRVKSMVGLLENEPLPYFRQKIITVLTKKLNILIKGYKKRHKLKDAQSCKEILKSLSKY